MGLIKGCVIHVLPFCCIESALFLSNMSMRPREAVEEASRFSLRTVFQGNGPSVRTATTTAYNMATQAPVQPQPQPQPQTAQGFAYAQPAVYDEESSRLGNAVTKLQGSYAPPPGFVNTGFKFTLPTVRVPETKASALQPMAYNTQNEGTLSAGYLTGGSGGSQAEVMRLTAVVEEMSGKLKKATEKLAKTEQSVVKGNIALNQERTASLVKIHNLSNELAATQQREAQVRAELAAVPKISDFEHERFKIQAEGAVALQSSYDLEVKKSEALAMEIEQLKEAQKHLINKHEAHANELREAHTSAIATHDALLVEHANTCAQLEELKTTTCCNGVEDGKDVQQGTIVATDENQDLVVRSLIDEIQKLKEERMQQAEETKALMKAAQEVPESEFEAKYNELLKKHEESLQTIQSMKEQHEAETETVCKLDDKIASLRSDLQCASEARDALEHAKSELEESLRSATDELKEATRPPERSAQQLSIDAAHTDAVALAEASTKAAMKNGGADHVALAKAARDRTRARRLKALSEGKPMSFQVHACNAVSLYSPPTEAQAHIEKSISQNKNIFGVAKHQQYSYNTVTGAAAMEPGMKHRMDRIVTAVGADMKTNFTEARDAWVATFDVKELRVNETQAATTTSSGSREA